MLCPNLLAANCVYQEADVALGLYSPVVSWHGAVESGTVLAHRTAAHMETGAARTAAAGVDIAETVCCRRKGY